MAECLGHWLKARFGEDMAVPAEADLPVLAGMAQHRTLRRYLDRAVELPLLQALCGVALSAPSKSDLQQADIIIVRDAGQRAALAGLLPDNPWARRAPAFLVFCGNNARQRRVHELRGHPFVNDHLDAFFNAAVDGAIVLATFIAAAEATGLGTCPISAIRNHPEEVARILALPAHVFPIAGLCVGWPSDQGALSPRLGLRATVHVDRHDDSTLDADIAEYDARRNETRPFNARRRDDLYGAEGPYGWSEDKARHYSQPERAGWGAFVKGRGFKLE